MTEQPTAPAKPAVSTLKLWLASGCLLTVFLLLNLRTLGWPFGIVDAPILIAQAILFSPIEYFTTASAYDFLSYNNFTPLITLSWDIDYTLFDLNEEGYRAHQLVSLVILLALLFRVLLLTTRSVLVATLFTFGIMNLPATYSVLDVMVNRHYIEGMIFAVLSYLAFRHFDRSGRWRWLAASVVCYGVAATAKEVYLPLPGILFFLSSGSLIKRIYTIVPYALVLAAYLALRFHIIGGSGGYTGAADTTAVLADLNVLGLVVAQIIGGIFAQPVTSLVLLGIALFMAFRDYPRLSLPLKLAALMGLFVAVLPLLALLPMMAAGFVIMRWIFVPSVLLMLYLAYLCSRTDSHRIATAVYCIVLLSSSYAAYERITAAEPLFAKGKGRNYQTILESDENRFLLFSNFSQLAAENYSVWVYIAKLRNGSWGTLPIVNPQQAAYHDLAHREPIPMGRKARRADFLDLATPVNASVIERAHYDPATGLVNIDFDASLPGEFCSIYLFNEHNGIVFGQPNCRTWLTTHRQIVFQLRKAGMALTDTQFAIWSDDPAHPWRSRALPLAALLAGNKNPVR